ncbi:hypothetical protein TWF694_002544 [Orbilia ellipsospora]|uniref:Uncharacterized protein n=1 Tax=Orbilia ellipsospora TaxID=2528407 RepID=A0AAV9X3P4_9PEZI
MISSVGSAIRRARSSNGFKRPSLSLPLIRQTECILDPVSISPPALDLFSDLVPQIDEIDIPKTADLPPEATRKQLLPLLRLLGCADDIPKPRRGTTNLGYTNPQEPLNRALRRKSLDKYRKKDETYTENRNISLAGLTARYILHKVWPERHELHDAGYPLRPRFFAMGAGAREYLRERNSDASDIGLWSYVLLARTGSEAIARLEWLCHKINYRVPSFAFNHTLRHLSGHSIWTLKKVTRLLDEYLTRNDETSKRLGKPQLKIDSVTKRIMFLRLFRLANYFAPRQLLDVAEVYAKHSIDEPAEISKNDVTFCNHIIWAIGNPPRISAPYWVSLKYIIDTQVFLLRKMFHANPVMHLDPKGFRGIVRTRLAAPRTAAERGMISRQGLNWPPWKDIRDGYDEAVSRIDSDSEEMVAGDAGRVLAEMQRSGFPLGEWEKAAMVLSGREEDGTPTPLRRIWFVAGRNTGEENPFTIWQARIRGTRTLNESWHVFIKFLNVSQTTNQERSAASHVFQEMFDKVLQARKQDALNKYPPVEEQQWLPPKPREGLKRFVPVSEAEQLFIPPEPQPNITDDYLRIKDTTIRGPTDIKRGPNLEDRATVSISETKNLLDPPSDPAKGAYVPAAPPTVDELWALMLRRSVPPSIGLIRLLITNSASVSEAHRYLQEWYRQPSRRHSVRTAVGKEVWEWWTLLHRKELEKLDVRQFGVYSSVMDRKSRITSANTNPLKIPPSETSQAVDTISASPAILELATAYIIALTNTTYAPLKSHRFQDHFNFGKHLLFGHIPHAIILATAFRITSLAAWTAILRALNYTRHHRGLFQSSWARTASGRLASARFGEGNPNRKMRYRDVNVCVVKVWEYVREVWGYPQDMAFVYELVIAAEKGWEYERLLSSHNRLGNDKLFHVAGNSRRVPQGARTGDGDGDEAVYSHRPLPWRAEHAVEVWECVVGVRKAETRSFKSRGAPKPKRLGVARELEKEGWFGVDDSRDVDDGLFEELAGLSNNQATDEISLLPPITTPRTAHIHAYVRLLLKTAVWEFEPVIRLLRWMIRYKNFLEVKNRRLPLIALRAMLDLYVGLDPKGLTEEELKIVERRREKFEEAERLVREQFKEWGGWATNVEVAAYNGLNWRELREGDIEYDGHQEEPDEEFWREEGTEEGGEEEDDKVERP